MITKLLGTLTWKLFADAISALIGRIGWQIIIERMVTRIVVAGLRQLESMTSNRLVTETVDDIIKQLQADGLKKANE
ncbi:hypothetical protein [Oceanobacter mangrovi]|uniref:hypothetical protein n=1 Tax=Oceanobacter mangrovi TaxID=2862510 RepID=UPI001C8E3F0E|nr:hypothetical protein [Oceanobacter mangrovi]